MQALILAAGAGSRMGGRPKCLLTLEGQPLLVRHLRALQAAGCTGVTVVLGHYAADITRVLAPYRHATAGVTWLENPDPSQGQISSLRLGLSALGPDPDGVLVVLSDQPLLEASDFLALKQAYESRPSGCECVVPRRDGVPGNPVALGPGAITGILAGDAQMGGKQWQKAHPEKVHAWFTDNPHYFVDVDTLEDLEGMNTLWGKSLSWPAC
jgi:CTP:molybdopterin cytidylyltransferase MocA